MAETKRVAELTRTTKETDIALSLNIDGTGFLLSIREYLSLTICWKHLGGMAYSILQLRPKEILR